MYQVVGISHLSGEEWVESIHSTEQEAEQAILDDMIYQYCDCAYDLIVRLA